MKLNEIKNFKNRMGLKIREGALSEAFAAMRAFSEGGMTWEITSGIDRLEDNYRNMLRYVASGAEDPGREAIYAGIVNDALGIVDVLTRRAFMAENPALYYNTARTIGTRQNESVRSLVDAYRVELRRLDNDFESIADPQRTRGAENLLRDIFNRLWVTHPLSADDIAAARELADDSAVVPFPAHARAVAVSAMTLGLLEFYDPRRLEFLLATYMSATDAEVGMRAFVGALAAMYRFKARPVPPNVANVLAAAKESPMWNKDFATAAIEFMRACETDRISDKMNKEVFPSLMKIDPEIRAKLQAGDFDLESLADGFNPEWAKIEEKIAGSDMARSLRELSEIQAEGGDVFMGSFSHMKQFPFFSDIVNWFMPFVDTHSAVASADSFDGAMGSLLSRMPILCDSDKYSVALSFSAIPQAQREAAMQAIKMQSEQMRDMLSEVEKASDMAVRRNIVNKYIQNLYRFYKLFRRKGEFFNIFGGAPSMLEVDALAAGFNDEELLAAVADFYFRHKFWHEAAVAFGRLDAVSMPEARRSQQWGYALECEGDTLGAISRYEEAELLDGGSQWTLRRLAGALRREGRAERAAGYYRRLADMLPDDPNVALNYGYALTEAGQHDKAEAQFHKAAYLMPDSLKPLRGLAWTQFLNRKYDQAVQTYEKIIGRGAIAEDYLNAGHVSWASGNLREAMNFYRLSAAYEGRGVAALEADLNADRHILADAGIDTSGLKLIVEALMYSD